MHDVATSQLLTGRAPDSATKSFTFPLPLARLPLRAVMSESAAGSTLSTSSSPSNLELKPEWPLISDDHTALSLFSGIPRWTPPPASATIVEQTYTAADVQLIQQLRNDTRAHLQQNGITQPEQYNLKGLHWRDIYSTNRHLTATVPTPDPRAAANYQTPAITTDWPDYFLHQFLVARRRKLDKAQRMLLDYTYWWHSFGMDDLCAQPVCPFGPEVAEWYPERMHGVDKDGRPFVIGYAGGIDLAGYTASGIPVEVAYIVQAYKREFIRRACVTASARCGRRVYNVTVVTSLNGFNFGHRIGFPWVRAQAYIDSNFYPETAGQVLVVSAPSIFSWWAHTTHIRSHTLSHPSQPIDRLPRHCYCVLSRGCYRFWTILKTFIDEKTQEKIVILGADFSDTCIARVGRDATPAEWKGGCTLCDGHCMPILRARDTAAEARKQEELVSKLEGRDGTVQRELTVVARAEHDEKLTIAAKPVTNGSTSATDNSDGADVSVYTVWWSVAVRAKDIDFSVHFTPTTGDAYTVKSVERLVAGSGSTKDGRVRGSAAVHVGAHDGGGGVVKLTFSNAFSMFSSKTVEYKVGVVLQDAKV